MWTNMARLPGPERHAYRSRNRFGGGGGGGSHGLTHCTIADAITRAAAPNIGVFAGQKTNSNSAQNPAASTGNRLNQCFRRRSVIRHQRTAPSVRPK